MSCFSFSGFYNLTSDAVGLISFNPNPSANLVSFEENVWSCFDDVLQ